MVPKKMMSIDQSRMMNKPMTTAKKMPRREAYAELAFHALCTHMVRSIPFRTGKVDHTEIFSHRMLRPPDRNVLFLYLLFPLSQVHAIEVRDVCVILVFYNFAYIN
jgi:hypothetical protein